MSLSFSHRQKLLHPEEFKIVFQKGRRLRTFCFQIVLHKNNIGHARLGLVVAKKQVADAVDRNCFKRQVREAFRLYQAQLPQVDLVVCVFKEALRIPIREFRDLFEVNLQKLKMSTV